jgi:tetratricopeptide (TPR) repeat protein/outer membrane protein OmpA-like peptidoglycan-associated protein
MMRTRILLLSFALLALAPGAWSQTLDKVFEIGEESFKTKDYYSAFRCYEEVLKYSRAHKLKSDTLYIKYKYAEAAQRFNYLQAADSMYSRLLEEAPYSRLLEEAPEKAQDIYARSVFRLAQVKQSRAKDTIALNYSRLNPERLGEAQQLYERFLDEGLETKLDARPEEREAFRRMASSGIESCAFAIEKGGRVPTDTVFRLSDRINSRFSDLGAVLRENTMFFSSIRHYGKRERLAKQSRTYSKIHRAEFMPGDATLSEAKEEEQLPEEGIFNEDHFHTVHTAFSNDGNWMFFSRCFQQGDTIYCTLYRRIDKGDGTWGKPEYLTINVDSTRYTSQQPSVARIGDKEWLLFASNRPGTQGGLDIWRAELRQDGSFGEPENFTELNSPANDATPFYHELSGQMFFSSDREPSFGLYDIFVSYQDSLGRWKAPDNLGQPFNSGYNDQYYFLSPDGSMAYFSSDRPESMRFKDTLDACCHDIYGHPVNIFVQLELEVLACGEDVTSQAEINIYDLSPGENPALKVPIDSIKRYHQYRIVVNMPGFLQADTTLVIDHRYRGQDTVSLTMKLKPEHVDLFFIAYDQEMPHFTFSGEKLSILLNGEEPMRSLHPERSDHYQVSQWEQPLFLYARADFKIYKPIDTVLTLTADVNLVETCVDTIILPLEPLKPADLDTLIIFYFDNDKPDRDRPSPTDRSKRYWPLTKFTFEETFEDYYAKKEDYLAYNLRSERIAVDNDVRSRLYVAAEGEFLRVDQDSIRVRRVGNFVETIVDSFLVRGQVNRIFETELRGGLENLNALCAFLEDWLSTGRDFEMEVQGFCSIRGNREYNDSLANRRILCIRLSMEEYNDGVLKEYIQQGQLRLAPKPVGASDATTIFPNPNMNPNRDEGGIYSLPAMLDRRVELRVTGANLNFYRPPTETSSESNLQIPGQ